MSPEKLLEGALGGSVVAGIAYGLSLWSENVSLRRRIEDLKVQLLFWKVLALGSASTAAWVIFT